jgi:hypothetical protein
MNLKHLALAACIAAVPQVGMADDAHHSDQAKPAPAKPAAKADAKGMGGMMGHMQENMKRMQDEMAAIRAAKDPKEKERLMDEHMKTMESSMATMRKMMEGGKMKHGGGK